MSDDNVVSLADAKRKKDAEKYKKKKSKAEKIAEALDKFGSHQGNKKKETKDKKED